MARSQFTQILRQTMKGKKDSESIQKQAKAHIELGNILKRERDETSRKIVERILQSDLSIRDKIEEIEKLDSAATRRSAQEAQEGLAQPFITPLSVIKSVIKLPHTEASYFYYLFHYHKKCKEFGETAHLLTSDIIPPRVRLNPDIQSSFQTYLQADAAKLLRICELALESGWRYLDKMQYNLIVVLQKLCYEIISVNFRVLNYKDRNLVDHLRTLETLFFVLHYRSDYPEILIDSLSTAVARDRRIKQEKIEVSRLVERILFQTDSIPSLYNFILGANMVKYRRFFSLDELLCCDLGELLNTKEFACKPEMRGRIDEQVATLKKELGVLRKRYGEIDHIKRILYFKESGEIDFSGLRELYDSSSLKGVSLNFLVDQDNVMVIAPGLMKVFDSVFYPLLNGVVRLSGVGEVTLFTPEYFQMEFHKLRGIIGKLEEMAYSHHTFSMQRFKTLKTKREKAVQMEDNVIRLIDDGFALVLKIGKILEDVLDSTHRKMAQDRRLRSSGRPVIAPGRDFFLPDRGSEIVSKNFLNGKTVVEALQSAVQLAHTAAAFFHNEDTLGILNRELSVKKNISKQIETLQRIADPRTLREIER
jgi:hypothetical protein